MEYARNRHVPSQPYNDKPYTGGRQYCTVGRVLNSFWSVSAVYDPEKRIKILKYDWCRVLAYTGDIALLQKHRHPTCVRREYNMAELIDPIFFCDNEDCGGINRMQSAFLPLFLVVCICPSTLFPVDHDAKT